MARNRTTNTPQKDEYPGFQFVSDDVKVGGQIWHLLDGIKAKGRPYQVTKIVSPDEHASTYSDYGKFLSASMVHTGKIGFVCGCLKLILQNKNPGNTNPIYEICKNLDDTNTIVRVWSFARGQDTKYRIGFEYNGTIYEMNPTVSYLSLTKCRDFNDFKFNEPGFRLTKTLTPYEFVREYENVNTPTRNRNNAKT